MRKIINQINMKPLIRYENFDRKTKARKITIGDSIASNEPTHMNLSAVYENSRVYQGECSEQL